MGTLFACIRRYPATWFFAITLTVQAFLVWAEVNGYAHSLMIRARLYMPAVFALAMTYALYGSEGLKKTGKSLILLRLPWYWYAFALSYAPLMGVLPVYLFKVLGLTQHVEYDTAIVEESGFFFFKMILTISVVEEISWVSFGMVHLQKRFSPFVATLMGGAAWGLWYVPLNSAGIQVAGDFPNIPMVVNFMAIGACCGWLYYHTKSAMLVALMQVITNYASLTFPVLPRPGAMGIYYAFIAVKCVFALGLFLWKGPLPLFSKGKVREAAPAGLAA